MNKEQEKLQEDWEKLYERYFDCDAVFRSVTALDAVKHFIRTNFIAKRDLRKLLEGKKKQVSQYDDEIELHDDAWNYNLTIDEILAEIEKL